MFVYSFVNGSRIENRIKEVGLSDLTGRDKGFKLLMSIGLATKRDSFVC